MVTRMSNLPVSLVKKNTDSNDPETKMAQELRYNTRQPSIDIGGGLQDCNYYIQFNIYKYERFLQGVDRSANTTSKLLQRVRLPLQGSIMQGFNTNYSQFSASLVADAALATGGAVGNAVNDAGEAVTGSSIKGAIGSALPDFQYNTGASRFNSTSKLATAAANELAIKTALNSAAAFIPRGQISNTLGAAQNPRQETSFDGVSIRSHSFDFLLVPRNKKESEQIREVTRILKRHSLPEYADTAQVFLKYPEEFTISFVDANGEPLDIPPIPDSFLTSISVVYNANGIPRFHEDNSSTSYRISLAFVEQNQLTRTEVEEGGY